MVMEVNRKCISRDEIAHLAENIWRCKIWSNFTTKLVLLLVSLLKWPSSFWIHCFCSKYDVYQIHFSNCFLVFIFEGFLFWSVNPETPLPMIRRNCFGRFFCFQWKLFSSNYHEPRNLALAGASRSNKLFRFSARLEVYQHVTKVFVSIDPNSIKPTLTF